MHLNNHCHLPPVDLLLSIFHSQNLHHRRMLDLYLTQNPHSYHQAYYNHPLTLHEVNQVQQLFAFLHHLLSLLHPHQQPAIHHSNLPSLSVSTEVSPNATDSWSLSLLLLALQTLCSHTGKGEPQFELYSLINGFLRFHLTVCKRLYFVVYWGLKWPSVVLVLL